MIGLGRQIGRHGRKVTVIDRETPRLRTLHPQSGFAVCALAYRTDEEL